ncbi:hypothetical protein [Aureliella helgolandensis]|uniref:Uncharacterized protein n=1 Tax=Aureliella helgolandensis TaxID=2527968 RepID=A0A518G4U0_9BACT|nr:hypothetical protein [Aureliella helgolandensis]QDV23614.1 hypothetical protein Q31a_19170 [Aureliella helgolandensis]
MSRRQQLMTACDRIQVENWQREDLTELIAPWPFGDVELSVALEVHLWANGQRDDDGDWKGGLDASTLNERK